MTKAPAAVGLSTFGDIRASQETFGHRTAGLISPINTAPLMEEDRVPDYLTRALEKIDADLNSGKVDLKQTLSNQMSDLDNLTRNL